jgi:acyl dehydratase
MELSMVVVAPELFDITAIRTEWAGRNIGRTISPYPVEYDPIRRYCHMTGDTNPLYLDPERARRGPFGEVICPPGFLRYYTTPGPWPRPPASTPGPVPKGIPTLGDRGINMGVAWTFAQPVLVGDRITTEWTVRDVYVKPTRLDADSVWIVTEAQLFNQRDEPVGVWTNTVLFHRPARPSAGAPVDAPDTPGDHHDAQVSSGDVVTSFVVELTPTAAVLQVSGSQDWSLVHHDLDYARSSGHASTFFNTGWTQGLLCRLSTDSIADRGWWLQRLEYSMRNMNIPGDRVTARAHLRPSRSDLGDSLEGDISLSNDRVGVTTIGRAVIQQSLPTPV